VRDLIEAGHSVLGLTRSDAGAESLRAAGADVHYGNLEDPESIQRGAETADGVIHTAFNHDFSRFAENAEQDRRVIEALGATLAGSDRPLVITSGTGILAPGQLVNEETRYVPGSFPRVASEEAADAIAARGVRVSVVRLAPSVHGEGDHGFVPRLIALARETGKAAYIGEGQNRWAAVHRLDAARLFRLALEQGTPGARFHGVADEGVPFRAFTEIIGRRLNVPVVSLLPDDAEAHFGWFTHFAVLDAIASSARTQEQLGWHPTHPGLLADLDQPYYFAR
jgi:nucleoside-diphosphate-sugar epimerase